MAMTPRDASQDLHLSPAGHILPRRARIAKFLLICGLEGDFIVGQQPGSGSCTRCPPVVNLLQPSHLLLHIHRWREVLTQAGQRVWLVDKTSQCLASVSALARWERQPIHLVTQFLRSRMLGPTSGYVPTARLPCPTDKPQLWGAARHLDVVAVFVHPLVSHLESLFQHDRPLGNLIPVGKMHR